MNDNSKKKYSVVKSFMKPFWIIFDNVKTFLLQGACFSIVMVLLSYLMGQKYLCFFNPEVAQNMYCPNSNIFYFPYIVFKLVVIAIFINLWYDKVFKNTIINKQYFKQHGHYYIFDYYTAIEKKKIDDYFVWWGYEDKKLFEYAKEELVKLSNGDQPFNFTL